MRVRTLIVLGVAAALVLTAGSAFALTAAHQSGQTGYVNGGDCAACHIPHKAAGAKRGFPIEPATTTQATYGYIGAFCLQRCHDGTVANANTSTSVMVNFAGGADGALAGSHGLNLLAAGAHAPSSTVVSNTLPYGKNNRTDAMECTTCHNVHANATGDTSDALLAEDIDTLCDTCHTNRGAGDGSWSGYGYANATGSHPVGTNVTGDSNSPANSPIEWPSVFQVAYDVSGSGSHNLGGHLINGGVGGTAGMTCATCHAVHGSQPDANPPAVAATYTEDLLASAGTVGVTGTVEPNVHGTGAGDTNNTLCEGCHGLAASKWNPGSGAGSHPVDAMYGTGNPSVDMGSIANPSDWPVGTPTAFNDIGMNAPAGSPGARVICETCHTPHPNANANSGITGYIGNNHMYSVDNGTTPIAGVNTPLTRQATAAQVAQICNYCHNAAASPPGHHPVGRTLGTGYWSTGNNVGNGDATLTCDDCHGGSTNAAHNWAAAHMPSLDTDWIPTGNGRTAEDAITTGINAVTNTSRTCSDCHLGGQGITNWTRFSPSRVTPGNGNANYQDHGDGSHFLGAVAAGFGWNLGNLDGTAFDASQTTSNWNAHAGSHSRFAGTTSAPELVCESCHEIQPTRNATKTGTGTYNNLLLNYTYEGEAVAGTGSLYRSQLCEGCHGHNPGVTGSARSHPMTLDNVTKAFDAGRTPSTLITATTGYANASGSPNDGTYPAANAMNCDSCHQVHDANTQSGTWILDAADTRVTAGTARAVNVNLYGGTYTRTSLTSGNVGFQGFCTMCHAY